MKGFFEAIWYLIKLPFIIVFSAFKLIIFIILVIASIYHPIIIVLIGGGLLLMVIGKRL